MESDESVESEYEKFLIKYDIDDEYLDNFFEVNNIDLDKNIVNNDAYIKELNGPDSDLHQEYAINYFFKLLYSTNKNNEFLLINNHIPINTKENLNKYIITIYDFIKKELRRTNNDVNNIDDSEIIHLEDQSLVVETNLKRIIDQLLNNEIPLFIKNLNFNKEQLSQLIIYFRQNKTYLKFNYFVYILALILRKYDGHGDDFIAEDDDFIGSEIDEYNEYDYSHDYGIISSLKGITSSPDFIEYIIRYLQKIETKFSPGNSELFDKDHFNLKPSEYFLLIYNILVESFIPSINIYINFPSGNIKDETGRDKLFTVRTISDVKNILKLFKGYNKNYHILFKGDKILGQDNKLLSEFTSTDGSNILNDSTIFAVYNLEKINGGRKTRKIRKINSKNKSKSKSKSKSSSKTKSKIKSKSKSKSKKRR